ncbi:LysM peptidoglycan-binding domain-containing M23 family metallopeptidase [Anaerolineales bacterium HSG25]|nr:LysM peptidoglycan-binding domain-containing M23 family metallopeptidase [Anaerolineales bacterium HSG25]
MSYYREESRASRRRRTRRRLILLLLLLNIAVCGLITLVRGWHTLEQAQQDLHQALLQQAPSAITEQIPLPPLPEPTTPPSAVARLVEREVAPNPRSNAFTADLYLDTNLSQVVPWPNAGGRTEVISYTVEGGDNLFGIAFNYDLDLETLFAANPDLDRDNPIIRIGERLRILPVQGVYHRLGAGETLAQIAELYGVPPTHITNYPPNHLTRPYTASVGTGLIVPFGRQPIPGEGVPPLQISTQLGWPLVGLVSKGFHPSAHPGIQISAPLGTPVQAANSGTVISVSDDQHGAIIVIEHEDELESWYSHVQQSTVKTGDTVALGTIIGQVGRTDGDTVGSYLYLAVYEDNEAVDPLPYLLGGAMVEEE